jgi:hypothetical protein
MRRDETGWGGVDGVDGSDVGRSKSLVHDREPRAQSRRQIVHERPAVAAARERGEVRLEPQCLVPDVTVNGRRTTLHPERSITMKVAIIPAKAGCAT